MFKISYPECVGYVYAKNMFTNVATWLSLEKGIYILQPYIAKVYKYQKIQREIQSPVVQLNCRT